MMYNIGLLSVSPDDSHLMLHLASWSVPISSSLEFDFYLFLFNLAAQYF